MLVELIPYLVPQVFTEHFIPVEKNIILACCKGGTITCNKKTDQGPIRLNIKILRKQPEVGKMFKLSKHSLMAVVDHDTY